MKKIGITLVFIIITCGCMGQKEDLKSLKQRVDQSWITENPSIGKTQPSFFNQKNHLDFLVSELNFNGKSVPFVWDCDFSILDFLSKKEYKFEEEKHMFNDKEYSEVTIDWIAGDGLLWFGNKTYKSKIGSWYLAPIYDCVGIIPFPYLTFEKMFELKDARTNSEKGIAIIPYSKEIKNIVRNEVNLFSTEGKLMKGTGYDINEDSIMDVFIHYQNLDDEGFTGYRRLYLNVEGIWLCKWVEYYEECI